MGETTDIPATRDPDQQVLEACRRGDEGAFDLLVERHHRRIFRLCVRLLGDEDAALDAAQEAFVKAWRALARFEGGSLFTTWLTRIAINQCRNEQRRRSTLKHGRPLSLDAPAPGSEAPRSALLASSGPSALEGLSTAELAQAAGAALARLETDDREVLLLRDVEGLSYEEVAEVLDIPVGTVRSRLHRARAELRRRLEARA